MNQLQLHVHATEIALLQQGSFLLLADQKQTGMGIKILNKIVFVFSSAASDILISKHVSRQHRYKLI